MAAQRTHARDVDERRARMVLRQQQKDADSRRRRSEGPAAAGDKENRGPAGDEGAPAKGKADPVAVIKVILLFHHLY